MNEKENFIIEDLDEYHLVIKAEQEYRVRKELETEVCNPQFWFDGHYSSLHSVGKKYVQFRNIILYYTQHAERPHTPMEIPWCPIMETSPSA